MVGDPMFPRLRVASLELLESEEINDKERPQSKVLWRRVSRAVIQMRCTDNSLATFTIVAGCLGVMLQIFSLSTEHWLTTVEPRMINKTNEKEEQLETQFEYHSGFWTVCRQRFVDRNESFTLSQEMKEYFSTSPEFRRICLRNKFFSENTEIESTSGATAAIMTESQIVALTHIISLAFLTTAMVLSCIGYCKKDKRTLYGGILYISAGLCIATAILKYICVVDEEMSPRMKPTAEGEPSKYQFHYGYSFLAGALSFLVIQLCAVCQLTLFFRRYPNLEDKMQLIPGLKEKLRRAQIEREFGVSSSDHKIGQLSAHTSPKRSPCVSPFLQKREPRYSNLKESYSTSTQFDSVFTFDGASQSDRSFAV